MFTFPCHGKSAQWKSLNILKRRIGKSNQVVFGLYSSQWIQSSAQFHQNWSIVSSWYSRLTFNLQVSTSINVTWHSMLILCTWLFFPAPHSYSCILEPQNYCCSITSIVPPQQACYHTHDTNGWLLSLLNLLIKYFSAYLGAERPLNQNGVCYRMLRSFLYSRSTQTNTDLTGSLVRGKLKASAWQTLVWFVLIQNCPLKLDAIY